MSNRNFLWRLFQMYADNSMGSDSCKEDDENKQAKIIINVTSIGVDYSNLRPRYHYDHDY